MRFSNAVKMIITSMILLSIFSGCNKTEKTKAGNIIDVKLEEGDIYAVITFLDYGEVTCKLFPDIAPVAVEKFTALAERGFYELKTVHRVVKDALIQGGSLNGDGTDGELDESAYFDIEPSDYAKNFYGALCMAPGSSKKNFCQFYIINNNNPVDINADIATLEAQLSDQTKVLTESAKTKYTNYLSRLKKIPDDVKEKYLDKGGYYSLDGSNTVFGQVVAGFDVINAISNVEVVSGNEIDDKVGIFSKPANTVIIENVKIVRIPYPEPTTITEETTSKKSKPAKKTTKATEPEEALTDVVILNETNTVIEDESDSISENTENEQSILNNESDILSESVEPQAVEAAVDDIVTEEITADIAIEEAVESEITEVNDQEEQTGEFDIDSGELIPEPSIEQ